VRIAQGYVPPAERLSRHRRGAAEKARSMNRTYLVWCLALCSEVDSQCMLLVASDPPL